MDDEKFLTRGEAAEFLTDRGYKTAPRTLAKLASVGGGPVYRSFGRRVVYAEPDLIAWAKSRTSGPKVSTSEVSDVGGQP